MTEKESKQLKVGDRVRLTDIYDNDFPMTGRVAQVAFTGVIRATISQNFPKDADVPFGERKLELPELSWSGTHCMTPAQTREAAAVLTRAADIAEEWATDTGKRRAELR